MIYSLILSIITGINSYCALTATATKAALYVLARILFTLLFNADDFTVIILQWVLLPASIVAIFFGTIRAIFEKDIKKLLAFSSLSQIL